MRSDNSNEYDDTYEITQYYLWNDLLTL
jgi:hypothetical protein